MAGRQRVNGEIGLRFRAGALWGNGIPITTRQEGLIIPSPGLVMKNESYCISIACHESPKSLIAARERPKWVN
jgi:hypothetical protein